MSNPASDPIQQYIERLYEDEGLTDFLTDDEAQILLGWGEQQLKSLSSLSAKPDKLDEAAHQLHRVIRTMNRLMGQKTELSETQMVQRLLRLVEQAMQFSQQKPLLETDNLAAPGEEEA